MDRLLGQMAQDGGMDGRMDVTMDERRAQAANGMVAFPLCSGDSLGVREEGHARSSLLGILL